MIDLHTHTILSDGDLLPSELVRRAYVQGYNAIAITDHVDHSNIDVVLSGLVKASRELNKYWNIFVIPGVEITHVPLESFSELVKYARKKGAKLAIGHGESPNEPVIKGTNRACINAGVDILAHPGYITKEDTILAAKKGVYLELTAREGHSKGNKHVFNMARNLGARLVLNTDAHTMDDLFTLRKIDTLLSEVTREKKFHSLILENSKRLVRTIKTH